MGAKCRLSHHRAIMKFTVLPVSYFRVTFISRSEMQNLQFNGIPVVSFKNYLSGSPGELEKVSKEVERAVINQSAFFLIDHGMDWSIAENMIRGSYAFFALPNDMKLQYASNGGVDSIGYVPFATHNVHAFMGRRGLPNDAMERYSFGPEGQIDSQINQGIDSNIDHRRRKDINLTVSRFRQSAAKYCEGVNQVCEHVLRVFSVAMGQPINFLENLCKPQSYSRRANYYPVVGTIEPNQYRIAPHTDLSLMTILLIDDSTASLAALNSSDQWVPIKPPNQTFVIVNGDCTARMTNDHWPALLHKVDLPTDPIMMKPRLSLQLFVGINNDAWIETVPKFLNTSPNNYHPTTFKDLLGSKLKDMMEANASY